MDKPEIILIGLSHKTAPVALRECIAFSEDEALSGVQVLHDHPAIREALLFSTCNRVEILLVSEKKEDAITFTKQYMTESKELPVPDFEDALYIYTGDEAIRHIFRVAASLDSMILGEPQILGQIKAAYYRASQKKTTGAILNRLLHRAFFVAKRIRSITGIGDHAVSISYAAIELGRKIFDSLENKKVLLIGAGEMAEIAVEHLSRHRTGDIFVANRTFERGLELADRFKGQAIRFEEIESHLHLVDIIISSTGSSDIVLKKDQVKNILRARRNRPLFFIDIAVPRDIDPGINRLTNCYVYDIDDLKSVIDDNLENRQKEAIKGERIIDESVIRFKQWYEGLDVIPTVIALREKIEGIAQAETRKTLRSLSHLSKTDNDAIYRMANAITNKILHDPTLFLKHVSKSENKSFSVDLTRKLFKLDP